MSCKHPLKGFKIGVNPSGKDNLKITSYKMDHVELIGDTFVPVEGSFVSRQAKKVFYDWQEIPCGQCSACRLQYTKEWANRCLLEAQYHKKSYFITLTYDDDHLPTSLLDIVPESGEKNVEIPTLRKKDLQDFFKELRYYYDKNKIRYYACGEYGTQTCRSHYHCIIFGLELDDLVMYKRVIQNGQVYWYYTSEILNKAWKHKGFVIVAPATWESIAYTARYVMKKLTGPAAQFYEDHKIEPEFVVMSRRPGIAKQYFIDHPDMFEKDLLRIGTEYGGKEFGIPRYFKKMFDALDEEAYNKYKADNKRNAEILKAVKMSKTSLSYLDQLQVEEDVLIDKIKRLKRNKL